MFDSTQFYFNRYHMQSYQLPVKRVMMKMMQKSIKVNKVNSLLSQPSSLPNQRGLPVISPNSPLQAPRAAPAGRRRRQPRLLRRRRPSSPSPRRFRAQRGWRGMWRLLSPRRRAIGQHRQCGWGPSLNRCIQMWGTNAGI